MTNATRAGLAMAGGALAAWLAMAGPLPESADGERAARLAQTAPLDWTRAACLPAGEARHVEAYLEGRGVGFVWARYDDPEGDGAGEVEILPVGTAPIERDPSLREHIQRVFPRIQASDLLDLRGFWAVTRDPTGAPRAWRGAESWGGSEWVAPAPPALPVGAEERLADVSVSDSGAVDRVWVPFEANYGCAPSAPGCRQVGVKAFRMIDPRTVEATGDAFFPAVAPGAARFGIADVFLVPRRAGDEAWVVGHAAVYRLPFAPLRDKPIDLPRLDPAAGVGGYASAAAAYRRAGETRLMVALWTETRGRNGLRHEVALHRLDGTDWATPPITLTGSPLLERGAAYDRVVALAAEPDEARLWVASFGGGVLEVDATVFARPQWLSFADADAIGLAADERILDLAVAGTGDNRLVVLGTTRGVIASRDVCAGSPPTATETPGSAGPTTPAARATDTPTATEERATDTPPVLVSPTPTATRVQPPLRPVYLPIAVARGALTGEPGGGALPVDVVWLVDRSTSMLGRFGSGRQSILAAVASALGERAKALPAGVQAAVVAFDEPTQVLASLTGDRALLAKAIDGLVVAEAAEGSRLDLGLTVARRELAGPARQPSARPAVVVLSDGTSTRAPTADEVAKAAVPLLSAGTPIWAIALGPDADAAWLAAAAGEARVLRATDAIELDAALTRIERALRAP